MTQERKLGTGEVNVSNKTGSREVKLSYSVKPSKWLWFLQISPLILVLVGAGTFLGWWLGRSELKKTRESVADVSNQIMKILGNVHQGAPRSNGVEGLILIYNTLKNEIMMGGNELLSQCRAEGQSNIQAIFEIAKQHCYPKSNEVSSEIIPRNVSRTYFILDGKTRSLAEVKWSAEKSFYEVSLIRTSEKGSFAGVCFEFAQPIDLTNNKFVQIELWTNAVGKYEFVFEKKFFSEGQSKVGLQVDKIRQWTEVKISTAKVDRKVLHEMSRFCISISESISQSPTDATMEIRRIGVM